MSNEMFSELDLEAPLIIPTRPPTREELPPPKPGPVREIQSVLQDSGDVTFTNRLLVGTASTGLVRMEWVTARYGVTVPCNWSMVQMTQFVNGYVPLRYQVAEAQNLIVRECLERNFEWLLFIEHDTMPTQDALVRLNEYMRAGTVPIVSGLYFTKSEPSEPLVYRGRGTSFYDDWKPGDLVWVDGVPTGMLLIHHSILRAIWDESPEYMAGNQITRRVFETARKAWFDPQSEVFMSYASTSDLNWCDRIIKDGIFKKAGWPDYADKPYPFLIDTNIFCKHISQEGIQYPSEATWKEYLARTVK